MLLNNTYQIFLTIDIFRNYEVEFIEDIELLNIKQPDIIARVTDFIPQILNFIQDLYDKDLVYSSSDGKVLIYMFIIWFKW